MIRKIMVGVILLVFAGTGFGCGLNQSLMKAPRLAEPQEELKESLKDIIGSEAKLINLEKGDNKSAIQFVDLNNDKKDEAIVFYTLANEPSPIRLLVLTKKNNQWESKSDFEGNGYGVNRVWFSDINGDKQAEIIIGWQLGSAMKKGVSIYKYWNGNIEEIFSDSYDEMAVADLDNDNLDEMILIKHNKDELKAKAELYKYLNGIIKLQNEVKMDGAINVYQSVKVGKANDNQIGLFVDAGMGAHSAVTDLLVIENGQLKNVFFNETKGFTEKTFKAYPAYSEDIDQDEIIEIPLLRPAAGYEKASMAETKWITSWYQWDGKEGLQLDKESYLDYQGGYQFKFPAQWNQNITMDVSKPETQTESQVHWTRFLYMKNDKKYPLFTIHVFNTGQWNEVQKQSNGSNQEYEVISRNLNRIYAVARAAQPTNPQAKKMLLDIETIKANFKTLQ